MEIGDVLRAQTEEIAWLQDKGVERPSREILDFDTTQQAQLSERLFRFAQALQYLYSRHGELLGQRKAIKEGIDTGMAIAMTKYKGKTNAEREAQVLIDDEYVGLKDAKRFLFKLDAKIEMYDGWVSAYKIAWETVSRQITMSTTEASLSRR